MRWRPGSAPDSTGGAYSALPDPLAGFRGPTSKKREGEERRDGTGGEKRGSIGKCPPPY